MFAWAHNHSAFWRERLDCVGWTSQDDTLTAEQREGLVTKIQRLLGFDCPVDIVEVPVINWGETDKRLAFAVLDQSW